MTIIEAVKLAMQQHAEPMTPRDAYDAILSQGLYEFHAQNPYNVVLSTIRRHSEGIDFPSAKPTKHFRLELDGKFSPLNTGHSLAIASPKGGSADSPEKPEVSVLDVALKEIQELQQKYVAALKDRIKADLRALSPGNFEVFAKQLMEVYGFEDVIVTDLSGDGGIDGHGKLKVGLAHIRVTFQCKRWTTGNIQRPEIDKFRGAAQGDFEQGIFFATTSFSSGAIGASIKRGAIPIVLIDLDAIVDLMLEKQFGVQIERTDIPVYALDLALSPDDQSVMGSKGALKR